MTGLVTAAPYNNSMIDIFARRSKVTTRAIGIADILTPVQVRVFSDCEMRWFYEHLLAVPDPPTTSMALDGAMRAIAMTSLMDDNTAAAEGLRVAHAIVHQRLVVIDD